MSLRKMRFHEMSLYDLTVGTEARIVELRGGHGFQSRLRALGLSEGQVVRKLSKVGWGGPVIVIVNRAQVALGRGMARRIMVERY
jgi:ferrous iron transport protein A